MHSMYKRPDVLLLIMTDSLQYFFFMHVNWHFFAHFLLTAKPFGWFNYIQSATLMP